MNYAKKLLALILLFCMVVNLVPAAFAENDGETPPTDETVTEAGEEPMPEEPAPEEPIPEVPPDETPPQDEIVPEEPTEQPPEETETVPPDDPAEAPTEEAAEGETTCFPLRIKNTRKALANLLSPWYSVCSEVLPTNGCPRNLIRLLRQAVEGFWTE